MKEYDAYLFDWDGTLADSHSMWFALFRKQLVRYGINASDIEISQKLFGRYEEGIREYKAIPREDLPHLTTELNETVLAQYPLVDMFGDAKQVLETLKRKGKKLALITASYRETIDIAISRHDLLELFDVTVAGNEVTAQKPDPSGIRLVLDQFGIKPAQAIMMGDSPKDLLAARNAGTDSLLFFPPEHELQHNKDELLACKPTYTIHSWRELLDRLQ